MTSIIERLYNLEVRVNMNSVAIMIIFIMLAIIFKEINL